MGYVRRLSLDPGFFHVWIRGVCGVAPFPTDGDKTCIFERFLRETAAAGMETFALSVMSTHYHAVVYADPVDMAACFQELHSTYALAFNRRYGRFGHAFAERYSSKPVEEDGVYDRSGYVLGNPVTARLVDRIQDWPWNWCCYGLDAF
jgi:putative transposase